MYRIRDINSDGEFMHGIFPALDTAIGVFKALKKHSFEIELIDEGGEVIKSHKKKKRFLKKLFVSNQQLQVS